MQKTINFQVIHTVLRI